MLPRPAAPPPRRAPPAGEWPRGAGREGGGLYVTARRAVPLVVARGRGAAARGEWAWGAERARQVGGLEPEARGPRPTEAGKVTRGRGQPTATPRPAVLPSRVGTALAAARSRHARAPPPQARDLGGNWPGRVCIRVFLFHLTSGETEANAASIVSFPNHPGHSPFLPVSFPGPHPSSAAGLPAAHPTTAISRKGERGWRGFSKQTQGFGVRGAQAGGETDTGSGKLRAGRGSGSQSSGLAFPSLPQGAAFPVSTSSGLSALPLLSHLRGAAQGGEGLKAIFPDHPTQGLVSHPRGQERGSEEVGDLLPS